MTTQEKIEHIADHYGFDNQCLIAVEEMSEFTKEICKYKRDKGNYKFDNFIEELADVEIMVRQIKYLLSPEMVDAEIEKKLDRQLKRIEAEKEN